MDLKILSVRLICLFRKCWLCISRNQWYRLFSSTVQCPNFWLALHQSRPFCRLGLGDYLQMAFLVNFFPTPPPPNFDSYSLSPENTLVARGYSTGELTKYSWSGSRNIALVSNQLYQTIGYKSSQIPLFNTRPRSPLQRPQAEFARVAAVRLRQGRGKQRWEEEGTMVRLRVMAKVAQNIDKLQKRKFDQLRQQQSFGEMGQQVETKGLIISSIMTLTGQIQQIGIQQCNQIQYNSSRNNLKLHIFLLPSYQTSQRYCSALSNPSIPENDLFLPSMELRFQLTVFGIRPLKFVDHYWLQKSRELIKINLENPHHFNHTLNKNKITFMTLPRKKSIPIYVDLDQLSEQAVQPDQEKYSDDEIQIQTQSYNLRVAYVHSKLQIRIAVLEQESQDTYGLGFGQQKLPFELAFYQTIQNVYLALKQSQALNYSIQQKYLQLQDIINNKPKKTRLALSKMQGSSLQKQAAQKQPIKLLSKQQQLKQAQSELKLLQSRYEQMQKNVAILTTMLKQSQEETAQKQKECQLQKLKVQSLEKENEQLRTGCYVFKRYLSDSIKEFQFYSKRRKDAEGQYYEASGRNSQVGLSSNNIEKSIVELDLTFESIDSMDSNIIEINSTQFIQALKH